MEKAKKPKPKTSHMVVNLHIFEPSGREVWTVVGTKEEHWLDPDANFCSCASYYFSKDHDAKSCSHLESVKKARKTNKVQLTRFSDSEYVEFVASISDEI